MSLIKEVPPTAGWPIKTKSLLPPLFKRLPKGLLEEDFKKYLSAPSALLTYSGTAAFYLILESIKKLSGRKTVIIPAFVCPLIPLAIKRAGLKIRPCDISRDNFDFDINKLCKICAEDKDILAILAVHLAGIPLEIKTIQKIAKEDNIFIIEDCAQSLGAEYQNRKIGSIGEFSFFSLCRGKGLTIYEGGIAITNQADYAQLLENTAEEIMHSDIFSECLKIVELFAYGIFYRPALFWFAFRLPQIFWQMRNNPIKAMGEYFETSFPIHKVSAFREYIGHLNFPYLNKEIDAQREKADFYLKTLKYLPGIRPITELAQTKASYPYLTLVFDKPERRNSALNIFQNSGLGVSQVYLQAITDYDYLKDIIPEVNCEQARRIAQQTITLSTSSFLKESDLKRIANKLKRT
ncbi:MAG: DegT/DnrJ/EryC1/StrS family aminotransferase [Candidatus Omnitrophica bacterium]|nr:DegT/DnrJ/EryC1/StrS family aminotransferase [Candidatus Omnitrophota bacterium]MBU1923984.1 DegT/DnrJ/EryC1/StrS family aminotransferase [Candidatus Omnitrophota bacterium]